MKYEVFNNELATITEEVVRQFAIYAFDEVPDYFYTIPASSTGRHHPTYALGDFGLGRHTKALIGIMNHLFVLEQYKSIFTERQMNLLRVAGLFHDVKKLGDDGSEYTVWEHPLLAGELIIKVYVKLVKMGIDTIEATDMAFIQKAIVSHMGQWNVSDKSEFILPKPETEAQKFLHLCDYLASRKSLEYIFGEEESKPFKPTTIMMTCLEEYRLPFGKYASEPIVDVAKKDMKYLLWLHSRDGLDTILKGYLEQIINNKKYANKC